MSDEVQASLIEEGKLASDPVLIRSSYELCLSSVARLAPFGITGEVLDLSHDINTRQTQLALDDIVSLAISLRRLASGMDMYGVLKNVHVPKIIFLRDGKQTIGTRISGHISLWTLLNRLVHSVRLEIVSQPYQVMRDLTTLEVWRLVEARRENRLLPVCLTKTEKEPLVAFHIAALCDSSSKALELAAERAIDFGIYLENFYNA